MPIKLIGAGLGRTSTRSLKDALEILGFDQTYHMTDLFTHPERIVHWEDMAEGRPVDWQALFDGYQAVVDFPGAAVWRHLVHAFPDAPVVLTVRAPAEWYDSVMATIFAAGTGLPASTDLGRRRKAWVQRHVWNGELLQGRMHDRAFAIAQFEEHTRQVTEAVPAERLLVLPVGSGWAPLCEFLDLPVPDVPYPNRNSRQAFVARLEAARSERLRGS